MEERINTVATEDDVEKFNTHYPLVITTILNWQLARHAHLSSDLPDLMVRIIDEGDCDLKFEP